MQVELSWTEKFLNFLPKTSLYIRGERKAKNFMETLALMSQVSKELTPFFSAMSDKIRQRERDRLRERFDMFPSFFSAITQKTLNGSEKFLYDKVKEYVFGEDE